jgi:hypothetical protein
MARRPTNLTSAQKLAASKAGITAVPGPTEKKRNALSAFGNWMMGGATAEDLKSPSWWGKGLVAAANDNLIQPIYRTASGQNLQTTFAPSSTMNQRINAIGEDALNIISLVPMAGPAARASVAAEQAGARALARSRGIKPTAPTPPSMGPKTAEFLKGRSGSTQASADAQEALAEARIAMSGTRPEYDFDQEGFMRLWHTGQQGEPLPPKLKTTDDAARDAARRGGTGGNHLLDSGLYNTVSGPMSGTYFDGGVITGRPPYQITDDISDKVVNFHRGRTIMDLDEQRRVQALLSKDLLDSAIDIRTPISESDLNRLRKIEFADLSDESFNALNIVTWEDYLRALPEGGPVEDRLLNQSLKFKSSEPAVISAAGKQFYSDANNPLYFLNPASPRGGAAFDEYVDSLAKQSLAQSDADLQDQLKRLSELAAFELLRNPKLAFDPTWKQLSQNRAKIAFNSHQTQQRAWSDWKNQKNQIAATQQYLSAPMNAQVGIDTKWIPGQNYFDVPVERTSWFPTGSNTAEQSITSIAGMPAMDIGNLTPVKIKEIKTALTKYFEANSVDNDFARQALESLDEIALPYDATGVSRDANSLYQYRKAMHEASEAVAQSKQKAGLTINPNASNSQNLELTEREKIFNFLRDELGYGSMPHPGGVTTGHPPHQAVVFSRPELLPPSTYVPGTADIYQSAMQRYNDSLVKRYFADQKVTQRNFMDIPQPSSNITAAQRMANRMAMAIPFQESRRRNQK